MSIFIIPIVPKKEKPAACSRFSDCCSRVSVRRVTNTISIALCTAKRLQLSAAFERTNAAFFCVGDEIKKFACRCAQLHRLRFFQRLRRIQPARVKKFESGFDFVSILRAETGAPQPNHVQAEDVVYFGCNHKGRDVFAETRTTLGKRQPAHAHLLVENAAAA